MKIVMAMASVLFMAGVASADHHDKGAAHGGAAPAAAAGEAKKMSKKEARHACKAEGKKGKELSACMKEKAH